MFYQETFALSGARAEPIDMNADVSIFNQVSIVQVNVANLILHNPVGTLTTIAAPWNPPAKMVKNMNTTSITIVFVLNWVTGGTHIDIPAIRRKECMRNQLRKQLKRHQQRHQQRQKQRTQNLG